MYKIISIEHADDVSLNSEQNWYRYMIANEFNVISGLKVGTKAEVSKHARLCMLSLNQKYKSPKKKRPTKYYKPVNINHYSYL